MIPLFLILFGAGFTAAAALALGTLLLRGLGIRCFYRGEERFFAFTAGSACLSLLVFLLAAMRQARPGVLFGIGAAAIAVGVWRGAHRPAGEPLPALPRAWRWAFLALCSLFGVFYLATALAPEISPDGAAYHLGLVRRYLNAGGFYPITTNIYASLSAGAEMLFLFAYAFGRHSAAALTHFSFYLALPLGMVCYGRRFGFGKAAVTGALLFFLAPIAGFDGSAAYIDVALACVLFAVFYLLQIWDQERGSALLVPLGLLAGFAYAIKYIGFLALPYAGAFVAWKLLRKRKLPIRELAVVGFCGLLLIAPWMIKNWVVVQNPLAPFYNHIFRNPYVHVGFEQQYRKQLAEWGEVKDKTEIPLEVTVKGARLQGLLGPAFLLLPLGLLALRKPQGRQLLLAAGLFLLTYPANIGTRFLLPMLPFGALALGMAVAEWRWAAPLLLAFHAITTWPPNIKHYCAEHAMRIEKFPYEAALRIETEAGYLQRKLPDAEVSGLLDQHVPAGQRVLAFGAPPEAYCNREVLVSYQGALNQNLSELLMAATAPHWQPTRRDSFQFKRMAVLRIRVVQGGSTDHPEEYWPVNELRVYRNEQLLPREPQWRLRSGPNQYETGYAFDANPLTRWRSWEPLRPGMFVELDFGWAEEIDRVELDSTPDHPHSKLWLEGWMPDGRVFPLVGLSTTSNIAAPADLRRWAASEIRWHGVRYLLVNDSDYVSPDMKERAAEYGVKQLFEHRGWRLYRID